MWAPPSPPVNSVDGCFSRPPLTSGSIVISGSTHLPPPIPSPPGESTGSLFSLLSFSLTIPFHIGEHRRVSRRYGRSTVYRGGRSRVTAGATN
uniref:Uncharacterized protein n=1 Tax=Leersia perrieri TaxID=77586 RepID=A0A0D9V481_9ORYZ